MIDPSALIRPSDAPPFEIIPREDVETSLPPAAVASSPEAAIPPTPSAAGAPFPEPRSRRPWRRPKNSTGPILDADGEPVSFAPDAGNVEYLCHVALMHPQLIEAVQGLLRVAGHDGTDDAECEACEAVAFGKLVLAKAGAP